MEQNLTKTINLFFWDQGTSLNCSVGVVLNFKREEKEWKKADNGEMLDIECGNFERVFLSLQNKEKR